MVDSLIVFSDYSSIVLQSESDQFEKLCALPPPDVLSDEVQAQTVEEMDRIRRMAADGPRAPNNEDPDRRNGSKHCGLC
ncbi:hypothetical protein IVB16_30625 [Bradyrhizobium sp. 183]|uniref:hypothetical protein n=1 Tax=unclassified Bradyrhizobium TaxID=2631580 RepID=UPI0020000969|nr:MULTISPECIES: hypothetical protein [unclassified Bradyrhizobium]UPJ79144.1 hypothetical protein IVB17_30625 [Bradyrhizobium sp. 184]UPJ86937.1 hypothetical protein IVB16_30625 [Bradyrhizobium sp. 183]